MSAASTPPALGLLRACHPLPTLAVTAFTGAYAAAAGATPARVGALVVPVLLGQLTVGWTNDAVDAPLDRAADRRDKPTVGSGLRVRTVAAAAALAGAACVLTSLVLLGPVAGLLHLVAVAAALGYDLRLKGTLASPLPYLLAFGLLPVVASLAAVDVGPPVAHVGAAALLGGAAHLTNTVSDATADALTGVRGLPQRWGPRRSVQVAAALVTLAAAVMLVGLTSGESQPVVLGLLLVAAAVALVPAVRPTPAEGSRTAFRTTLAAVALVVVALLVSA